MRIHDLFDFEAQQSHASIPSLPVADHRSADKSQEEDESEDGTTMKYNDINIIESTKASYSTATSSPNSSPTEASNPSMFDIQSSEDEHSKVKTVRPLKKRRLGHATSQPRGDGNLRKHENEAAMNKASKGPAVAKTKVKPDASEEMRRLSLSASNSKTPAEPSRLKPISRGLKSNPKTSMPKPSTHPLQKEQSPDHILATRTGRSKETRISSGSSDNLSDSSNPSRLSRRSTPKRKRALTDEVASGSASPSDLRMTSLRLTPEHTYSKVRASSDDEPMRDSNVTASPQRTGRRRLIDRLDAPRAQSLGKSGPTGALQAEEIPHVSFSQPVSGTASPRKVNTEPSSMGPSNGDRPGPALGPGRQRATYAKQRSHLSDMMDGLDSQPGSNSQFSSQQNFSQHDSFTSLASQLELENEDSDDADGFGHIKSIHELRRGGAIRKFDLDLDTILEDIESHSKSSRVQGLLQLMDKLDDLTFLRHFQDSGNFYRLTECARDSLDKVSATLMALVSRHMVSAEHSSPKILLQILHALYKLPRQLVLESRPLSKVAKDRDQNFSKLLAREVADFEERRSKLPGESSLGANVIVLGSIEAALRHLVNLKEAFPPLPRSLLEDVFSIFTSTAQKIINEDNSHQRDELVRLLLSLLELACANNDLAGSTLSSSRISDFSDGVAKVMTGARKAQPQTEHSCLRLIVSLSNDEPKVCKALAEGSLIMTVFQVIDDHFLRLAQLAAREQEFDHAQLESVILAVGCLQNLTECADLAREKMLEVVPTGKSLIDRLVDIFNSHVDQTSEVCALILDMDTAQLTHTGLDYRSDANLGGFWVHIRLVVHLMFEPGGLSTDIDFDQRRGTFAAFRCGADLSRPLADGRSCLRGGRRLFVFGIYSEVHGGAGHHQTTRGMI